MLAVLALLASPAMAADRSLTIVAAENFYADVAMQVAGPDVAISGILSNPGQDPHLFEASPSVARLLSAARIVICNGADYDPWMQKLLAAGRPDAARTVIVVADLVHKAAGDNPHLWYDPANVLAAAQALDAALVAADPGRRTLYEQRLHAFVASLEPVEAKVVAMRARFAGKPVTATEPVFGYMAAAIGLVMRNEPFQLAVMNGTEPSASDIAAFERDLRQHEVRAMLFNNQTADSASKRLLDIARASGVPVVGVSETEPLGRTYQTWMLSQLDALDHALSQKPPPS